MSESNVGLARTSEFETVDNAHSRQEEEEKVLKSEKFTQATIHNGVHVYQILEQLSEYRACKKMRNEPAQAYVTGNYRNDRFAGPP